MKTILKLSTLAFCLVVIIIMIAFFALDNLAYHGYKNLFKDYKCNGSFSSIENKKEKSIIKVLPNPVPEDIEILPIQI